MTMWEKFAPSYVGRGGFAPIMRLSLVIGAGGGFFMFYQSSVCASPCHFLPVESLIINSTVLRLQGEPERDRYGYERDG